VKVGRLLVLAFCSSCLNDAAARTRNAFPMTRQTAGSRPIRFGYPNPRHANPISRGLSRGNGSQERYAARREDARRLDGVTAGSIDTPMHLARGERRVAQAQARCLVKLVYITRPRRGLRRGSSNRD